MLIKSWTQAMGFHSTSISRLSFSIQTPALPNLPGLHHLFCNYGNRANHIATQQALLSLLPIGPWPPTKSTPRVETYIKICALKHVESKNKLTRSLQT